MSNKTPPSLDTSITLEGAITAVGVITLKNGKPCAFVTLECPYGPAELVMFPGVYEQSRVAVKKGRILKASVAPDTNEKGEVRYMVDTCALFDESAQ